MKRQKITLTQHFGEQLTGLSPTVCRRIIAAIREMDKKDGGEKREKSLQGCDGLLSLLGEQVRMDQIWRCTHRLVMPQERKELLELLRKAETLLNIVEGKEVPEERAIKSQ